MKLHPRFCARLVLGLVALCSLSFLHARAAAPVFEEQEIRAALQALEQALQADDPEAWVEHYTEDAVFVGEGAAAVRGRAALREMARQMKPLRELTIQPQRIEGCGTLAFSSILGSWQTDTGTANVKRHRVRSLLVWRKEADGRWRVAQESLQGNPE
jgi:uncharacterized protein (TIGR02246 family)